MLIPYVFWGVFYYLSYLGITEVSHIDLGVSSGDLFWQLITGHPQHLNGVLWFQANLIWITILFFLIIRYFKDESKIAILLLIAIISLYLQYSEINFRFAGELRYELRYPIGRFVEMLPIAVCGFIGGHYKVLERIKNNEPKKWLIPYFVLIVWLITRYSVFYVPQNFGDAGIDKIVVPACLMIIFYLAPLEKCPRVIKDLINWISKYTPGVYCLHLWVRNILHLFVQPYYGWTIGTFAECVVIFIVCMIISIILSYIPILKLHSLVE